MQVTMLFFHNFSQAKKKNAFVRTSCNLTTTKKKKKNKKLRVCFLFLHATPFPTICYSTLPLPTTNFLPILHVRIPSIITCDLGHYHVL